MNNIIIIYNGQGAANRSVGSWMGCILDMEKSYPDNFMFGTWEHSRQKALQACLGKAAVMDLKQQYPSKPVEDIIEDFLGAEAMAKLNK